MDRVDVAIIGSGPAGVSAAVNCKIRNKSMVLFGSKTLSAKIAKAELINNYPGIIGVTGAEYNRLLLNQINHLEIEIIPQKITGIYPMGNYFAIMTPDNQYEACSVILATGVDVKKAIKGEREFLGRGVSYCATCDGNLYKNKTIAVVSEDKKMEEELEFLADIAKDIYFFPQYKDYSSKFENVHICNGSIMEICGEDVVKNFIASNGDNLPVDGVFFLKNSVSADILLPGLKMDKGHIVVNRDMSTSVPGCFAAGDCTGTPYQIAKAVGEGNIALHSAVKYLAEKKISS